MRVVKFGGSSVASAERILAAAGIVAEQRMEGPVAVVVSAMAGVTDALLRAAGAALTRRGDWREELRRVEARHRAAYAELGVEVPNAFVARWQALLAEGAQLAQGDLAAGSACARAAARFSGWGERLIVDLVARAIGRLGLEARALVEEPVLLAAPGRRDAWDEEGADAEPSVLATRGWLAPRLARLLLRGGVPVLPGYIARDAAGRVTTLGRNGSDQSAAVIGAALGAEAVYLYSDVAGIFSADPRVVPEARLVPMVTYAEAEEIASLGARVLHPRTVAPLGQWSIPLRLRGVLEPHGPGTDVVWGREGGDVDERGPWWVVAARAHGGPGVGAPDGDEPGWAEVTALLLGAQDWAAHERQAVLAAVTGALGYDETTPQVPQVGERQLRLVVPAARMAAAQQALHAALVRMGPRPVRGPGVVSRT